MHASYSIVRIYKVYTHVCMRVVLPGHCNLNNIIKLV